MAHHIANVEPHGGNALHTLQPRDGIGSAPYTHYSADYNSGTNTLFTGGTRASYLLLPFIR